MIALEKNKTDISYKYSDEAYFEWLKSMVIDERFSRNKRISYDKFLKMLWDIPYTPLLGNDIDREIEGLCLRNEYANEFDLWFELGTGDVDIWGPCRVLEMLIGLSRRMYDIMYGSNTDNSIDRWFWAMIENVGLIDSTDGYFEKHPRDVEITKCVIEEIVGGVNRGKGLYPGGWFYVKNWDRIELWYQMNRYLMRFD